LRDRGGATLPPEFVNLWSQAVQQGFQPKAMTIGLALLFPESADALGDIVIGRTSELLWHPSWRFASSLTGRPRGRSQREPPSGLPVLQRNNGADRFAGPPR